MLWVFTVIKQWIPGAACAQGVHWREMMQTLGGESWETHWGIHTGEAHALYPLQLCPWRIWVEGRVSRGFCSP